MNNGQAIDGAELLAKKNAPMKQEILQTAGVRQAICAQADASAIDTTFESARPLLSHSQSALPQYRQSLFRR